MKKIVFIVLVLVVGFGLLGCTKKTTTVTPVATDQTAQTGGTGAGAEPAANSNAVAPATSGSQTASGEAAQSPAASGASTTSQIETYLRQNFEIAGQVSASPLKNQAEFCTVKIEFTSNDLIAKADQYFFFTSPADKMKDWYWIVEFDQLKGKRRRYLAPKKDYENEITCRANHDLPALGFATAYNTYLSANQGSYVGSSTAVNNVITLDISSWRIELYDAGGQMISSQQIDAGAQANQSPVISPTI
jgi:hypothetical protein